MHVFEVESQAVEPGEGSRIVVRGDLDAYRGAEVRAVLEEHLAAGRSPLELDCREVTFMDSGGLRVLVEIDERLRAQGSGLVLVAPSPAVIRLLGYTDLTERFAVV